MANIGSCICHVITVPNRNNNVTADVKSVLCSIVVKCKTYKESNFTCSQITIRYTNPIVHL